MTGKKKEEHWAFTALRKKLSEKNQPIVPDSGNKTAGKSGVLRITEKPNDWEGGNIFLFDPELKQKINDFFYQTLYPQVLELFEEEPYQIPSIDKINLRESYCQEATCNALFTITDPQHPISSADKSWWKVNFDLDIKADYDYYLYIELTLTLPFWLDSDWILDFMIDGRNWDNSPTLSVGRESLVLNFSWRRGSGYSFTIESEIQKFIDPFKKHLKIIKAIDRFSENSDNRFLKSYMLQVIQEFYGSN